MEIIDFSQISEVATMVGMETKNASFKSPMIQLPSSLRRLTLERGQTLVNAGDLALGLIRVEKGALKRYGLFHSKLFLSGVVATGESYGLEDLLRGETLQKETLIAAGRTTVVIRPFAEFAIWLSSAPAVLVEAMSRPTCEPNQHLRRPLALLPVRARVAATLWTLAERHAQNAQPAVRVIDLDLTREEIAHLAGTVYESVIRTLTALKKEGVIDLQGRVIRIVNENQLARIGQIAIHEPRGEAHDQDTVSENRHTSNNGRPKEAS